MKSLVESHCVRRCDPTNITRPVSRDPLCVVERPIIKSFLTCSLRTYDEFHFNRNPISRKIPLVFAPLSLRIVGYDTVYKDIELPHRTSEEILANFSPNSTITDSSRVSYLSYSVVTLVLNMKFSFYHLLGTLILWLVDPVHSALTPDEKKLYHDIGSGRGLYTPFDKVTVLNISNFNETVFVSPSPKTWIIEFYNSWCGHCHRFAPTWKSLASNILGMFY